MESPYWSTLSSTFHFLFYRLRPTLNSQVRPVSIPILYVEVHERRVTNDLDRCCQCSITRPTDHRLACLVCGKTRGPRICSRSVGGTPDVLVTVHTVTRPRHASGCVKG